MQLFQLLRGIIANILDWLRPRKSRKTHTAISGPRCIMVDSPGGTDTLRLVPLQGIATKGYNVGKDSSDLFLATLADVPANCCVVEVTHFSINYADICVRWGLYDSALKLVGWPIVPGFDISGKVSYCGRDVRKFKVGDEVLGVTFFGGYSSHVAVPENQLMARPSHLPGDQAAALPAVGTTAYHAIKLAGLHESSNKRTLVHSAGGGVGSALVQILHHFGHTVTGVVGLEAKRQMVSECGADKVLLKHELRKHAEEGTYDAIFDANGGPSLTWSYNRIKQNGRLIVYGDGIGAQKCVATVDVRAPDESGRRGA
eukprot:GEMP01055692.1.p1 GENE.GEMP01055692.1~~GEMP01055692.1.p1  ORF type:complete len:314 (+),score=71.64 GEMP01055692.1:56-997(+)